MENRVEEQSQELFKLRQEMAAMRAAAAASARLNRLPLNTLPAQPPAAAPPPPPSEAPTPATVSSPHNSKEGIVPSSAACAKVTVDLSPGAAAARELKSRADDLEQRNATLEVEVHAVRQKHAEAEAELADTHRQLQEARKALADAQKSTRKDEKARVKAAASASEVTHKELSALRAANATLQSERSELEDAARGKARALKHLQEESGRINKLMASERHERHAMESRLAHATGEVASLESKVQRLARDSRSAESAAKEARSRLEERRTAAASDAEEKLKLEDRVKSLASELARKERLVSELKAKVEQREAAMLAEHTAVESRAAELAAMPLRKALERKSEAVKALKGKVDSTTSELNVARSEIEKLRDENGKREARQRRALEVKAESGVIQLTAQLERAGTDREELRMLLHRLAHALEHDLAAPAPTTAQDKGLSAPAAGGGKAGARPRAPSPPLLPPGGGGIGSVLIGSAAHEEELAVRALAHSMLELSPEDLGLLSTGEERPADKPPKAPLATSTAMTTAGGGKGGGGKAAGKAAGGDKESKDMSHTQMLLKAALSDPVDAIAAFNVFSRLLKERSSAAAAAAAEVEAAMRRDAAAESKLEAAQDVGSMIKAIRSQVMAEKATSDVTIAQRDRSIAQLRAKLHALQGVSHADEENTSTQGVTAGPS